MTTTIFIITVAALAILTVFFSIKSHYTRKALQDALNSIDAFKKEREQLQDIIDESAKENQILSDQLTKTQDLLKKKSETIYRMTSHKGVKRPRKAKESTKE